MASSSPRLVVTGAGHAEFGTDRDAVPLLPTRKIRKFLDKWEAQTVLASTDAVRAAGLPEHLGERAGLYYVAGHVPIPDFKLDALIEDSVDENGALTVPLYSQHGYMNFNPFWTFGSLVNVPAYFVSACLDIQGPYYISVPEPGQVYIALEEAERALRAGRVEIAVVGATVDNNNELVYRHFECVRPQVPREQFRSGAGFLILELEDAAAERGAPIHAVLEEMAYEYRPHNPLEAQFPQVEEFDPPGPCSEHDWGASSLPMTLAQAAAGTLVHRLESRDGIVAHSRWEVRA